MNEVVPSNGKDGIAQRPSPSPTGVDVLPSLPPQGRPRRSRFTYRQLAQMAASNTANPLRVIGHIDLDAFYAQCEMVRLGIPEDQPLAVQQWQGLIAINYPARNWGIGRHCNVVEAKKMCPDLIAQHVATWREGEERWAYRDDAAANITTDKVSLDPYRLESRKILALVRDSLPRHLQKVEKASIDEVFVDLSAQVHSELLHRYPQLSNPPPYDDVTETLPLPPAAILDWHDDALIAFASEQGGGGGGGGGGDQEDQDQDQDQRTKEAGDERNLDLDWDDVAISIGSEIVRELRAQVRTKLGYTCSAGIANNKLVSKLGSAFKKPNRQTVVRARALEAFLADIKISKMRNLGGKLGEQVISTFGTDTVKELLGVPFEEMASKLGHETGLWVHNTIRGIDHSEVNSRTQIKSMLSAKSFRPPISTPDQAVKWLRIFVGDIFSRLVEEGVVENKRRPRTINLHHRQASQTKSRQAPIPTGKALDEQLLFSLAQHLLQQIISEGNVWPCANLSLSVGSFEDGVKGNMGIGAFLVKGDEAASLKSVPLLASPDPERRPDSTAQPRKKLRSDDTGIERFFPKRSPGDGIQPTQSGILRSKGPNLEPNQNQSIADDAQAAAEHQQEPCHGSTTTPPHDSHDSRVEYDFECSRCETGFHDCASLQSHEDWHFAMDLQEEERVGSTPANHPGNPRSHLQKGTSASSKRGRDGAKLEQGQSKLKFG